jgi:anti-sigma factor ChrR (cupin superfamily)
MSPSDASIRLDLAAAAQRPEALKWEQLRPGVRIHVLYGAADGGEERNGGAQAALLWYEAGASVPTHLHEGYEHIVVLAGAQQDERGRYEKGALVINPPGTSHSVSSPEGCVILIIWERPVRLLG